MKAQISLLFRGHAHLLKEYWVFYEQLHSMSNVHVSNDEDEEEDDVETDAMSGGQTVHGAQECLRMEEIENQNHIQVLL